MADSSNQETILPKIEQPKKKSIFLNQFLEARNSLPVQTTDIKSRLEQFSQKINKQTKVVQKNEDDSAIFKRVPFKSKGNNNLDFKLAKLGEQEFGLEEYRPPKDSKFKQTIQLPEIRRSALASFENYKPGELESHILRKKYRGS